MESSASIMIEAQTMSFIRRSESLFTCLAAVCLALFSAQQVWAQSAPNASKSFTIVHNPPQLKDLPYPGQPMKLVARLSNTRSTESKLRIALVKDGRFIEISAKPGFLNEYDQPTYEFTLPAPLALMTYQLLLYSPDGSVQVSPQRYMLRRNCVPDVDLAEYKIPPEVQGSDRLQAMVNQMNHLQKDMASYDQAQKLLDRLKELMQ
jgi:hypothetical protein